MEVKQITQSDILNCEVEIKKKRQDEQQKLEQIHKEWLISHSKNKMKEVRRIQAAISEIDKYFGDKRASEISVTEMNAFAIQTISGTTLDDPDLWAKASFAICCLDDMGEIDLSKITDLKAPGNWAVLTEGTSRRTLDQTTRITYDILRKLNAGGHVAAKKAFLSIESRSKVHKMLMQLTDEERSEFSETAIPRLMSKLSEIVKDEEIEDAIERESSKLGMSAVEWIKEMMDCISSAYNDQRWDDTTMEVKHQRNEAFMERYGISTELIYNSALKHNKDVWILEGSDIEYAEACIGVKFAYTGDTMKIPVDVTKLPSMAMSFLLQIALAFSLKTNEAKCYPGVFNIDNVKDIRKAHDLATLMETLERLPESNFSTEMIFRKYKVVNLLRGAPGLFCPLLKDLKIALTGSLAIQYENERGEKKWRTVQCFLPRAEEANFDKPLIQDEEYKRDLERFKGILNDKIRSNDYLATSKVKEEDIGIPRSVMNWKVNAIVKEIIDGLDPKILEPRYDVAKYSAFYEDCSVEKREDGSEFLNISGNYVLRTDYLSFLRSEHEDIFKLINENYMHLVTGAQFTQTVPVSDVKEDSTWEFDVRNHMLKSLVPIPSGYVLSGELTSQGVVAGEKSPNGSQLYRLQFRLKLKSESSIVVEKKSEIGSVVDRNKKIEAQGVKFYTQPSPGQGVYNARIRDVEMVTEDDSEKVSNYINKLTNQDLIRSNQGSTHWSRFGGSYIATTPKARFNAYLYLKPGFEDRLKDGVYYMDREEQMYNSSWFNLTMSTRYCDPKSPFSSSINEFACTVVKGFNNVKISLYGEEENPQSNGLSYIISRTHCVTVSDQIGYIRPIPKGAGAFNYMEYCERLPFIKGIHPCKTAPPAGSLKIDNRTNNVDTFHVFLSPVTGKKIIPMRCYRSVYFGSNHSILGRIRDITPSISDFLGIKETSGRVLIPIKKFEKEEDVKEGQLVLKGIVYHPLRIKCHGDTVYDMKHSSCQSTFEWFGAQGETNRVSHNPTDGQVTIDGRRWDIEVKCSQSLNRAVTNMMAPPYINTLLVGMSYESVIYSPELEFKLKSAWPMDNRITIMDAMLSIAIAWSKFQIENAGFSYVSRNKLPLKNEYSDKVENKSGKSLRDERVEQLLSRAHPEGKKDHSIDGIVSKDKSVKPSLAILHTDGDPDIWFKDLIREPDKTTLRDLINFHYQCPEGREEDDLTKANKENLNRIKANSMKLRGIGLEHFLDIPVRYDSIPFNAVEIDKMEEQILHSVSRALEEVYITRRSHQRAEWSRHKDELVKQMQSAYSGELVQMSRPFGDFSYPSEMINSKLYDWIMCLLSAFDEEDESFSISEIKLPNGKIENVHQENGAKFKGAMVMKIQRPTKRSEISNTAQTLVKLVSNGLRSSEASELPPQRHFNQVMGLGLFAPDTETMNKMIKKDKGCAAKLEAYKRSFACSTDKGDKLLGVMVRESLESVWFANLHSQTRDELVQKGHEMLEVVNQSMKAFMTEDKTPLEIDTKVRELAKLAKSSSEIQRTLNRIGMRFMSRNLSTANHKTSPLSKGEVNLFLSKLREEVNE